MKTDKWFYQLFLNQPSLLAELIPGLPRECQYDYSAPVIKEQEFRLDGIFTPSNPDQNMAVVFVEAQMQPDRDFYARYFAEVYLYLKQYKITRQWRGLLILKSRSQELGSEIPYQWQLLEQVQRVYLEDLKEEKELSPNLAMLQLIILPKGKTGKAAQELLKSAKSDQEFRQRLDLVQAILVNKFPQLTPAEILEMLDLKSEDISHTRYYQVVFQEGKQKGEQRGEQKGEAKLIIRLLNRRCGVLTPSQETQIRKLPIPQLEALGDALLDFTSMSDLDEWLNTQVISETKE
jgi:predicted transposase/invertase (TIGR01784 family)